MFELTQKELESLRYQIGTSNKVGRGGRRTLPFAFTEYGVVMLSSVLNSRQAIQVNIAVVEAFVRMKALVDSHRDLAVQLDKLEQKFAHHDEQFKTVFEAIRRLMSVGSPVTQKKIKGLNRS